jgi:hypothetical protein
LKRSIRALALLGLGLVVGCGGGGDDDDDDGGEAPLAAAWQYVSGPAFSGPRFSDEDFEGTLRYLVLEDDGHASLHLEHEPTGTLFCHHAVYAPTSDGLVIEVRRQFDSLTIVFLRDQPDEQTLELTDAAGATSVFSRDAAVPAEFVCQTLVVRATHPGLAAVPTFFTGMAWDGTALWFTDENETEVYPIDPGSGILGAPLPFDNSQFQMVHAAQGTDFWTHCRCGGSQEAQRRTQLDAAVDTVDTEVDLLEEISVRAIAWDSVSSHLWLHGFGDDNTARFLEVDSDSEPDGLLATNSFDVSLRSMVWDGTHMWGITDEQNVVRIDMSTFQAVATYDVPDVTVEWIGISYAPASVGGGNSLYLIGRDTTTGLGVLAEVSP